MSWKLYSGPGTVTFGNATQTNTTALLSVPGSYTLMLSADDAVHAVAYSAVSLTAVAPIQMSVSLSGTNLRLSWIGGAPPYVLEQTDQLTRPWSSLSTNNSPSAAVPISAANGFFRVRLP